MSLSHPAFFVLLFSAASLTAWIISSFFTDFVRYVISCLTDGGRKQCNTYTYVTLRYCNYYTFLEDGFIAWAISSAISFAASAGSFASRIGRPTTM
jgi:hypothetical protein